jgi:hypothetical protein
MRECVFSALDRLPGRAGSDQWIVKAVQAVGVRGAGRSLGGRGPATAAARGDGASVVHGVLSLCRGKARQVDVAVEP